MKRLLLLLLVIAVVFSAAACGKNDNKTESTTKGVGETTGEDTGTGSEPESTNEGTQQSTTESDVTSSEHTSSKPATSEVPDTDDVEELEFISESDYETLGFIGYRGSVEICLLLDGDKYGLTIGVDYGFYDWVIKIKDSQGKTETVELDLYYDFEADDENQLIKAYFGVEDAGFVPKIDEKYEITVYAYDDNKLAYKGTVELTAKVGYDENDEIQRGPQLLEWTVNNPPYETHHTGLPHEGRVVIVYKAPTPAEYGDIFTKDKILLNFDLFLYVDGEKFTITEVSSWSQGLRFGVEKAGFIPKENGQENIIWLELCDKQSGEVLFFIPKLKVVSNYPYEVIPVPKPPNERKYDERNISATGPAGFANEGIEKAFDGRFDSKYCVSQQNIHNNPILLVTEDIIELASISFVTANDSEKHKRVPTSIKVEGSTNGTDWTILLDESSPSFEPVMNYKEYNFRIDESKRGKYNHYRITFTANSTIQFSEIMLFYDPNSK